VVDPAVRFAPLMHRCVALRRRALGLDSVHYYDLNVPLSDEPLTDIPYEEACDLAVRALEPLGPDYVANLERAGAEAIVVDITTDEARQVGMHVIKALIPEAMPLSFSHHARYLATPRLYQAPRAMGLTVHDEAGINPVRQPFA